MGENLTDGTKSGGEEVEKRERWVRRREGKVGTRKCETCL